MSCPCGDITCNCEFCCCPEDLCSCGLCALSRKNCCRICRLPYGLKGDVCQCFLDAATRSRPEAHQNPAHQEVPEVKGESPVVKDKLAFEDSEKSDEKEKCEDDRFLSLHVGSSKSSSAEEDSARKIDFPDGEQMHSDTAAVGLTELASPTQISSLSFQFDRDINITRSSAELGSDVIQNPESKIEDPSLTGYENAACGTDIQDPEYQESFSTSEDNSTSDSFQIQDPKDAQTQTSRPELRGLTAELSRPLSIHIPNYTFHNLSHNVSRPQHEYNAAGAQTSLLTIQTYQTRQLNYPSNPNPYYGNQSFIPPIQLVINPYFSQVPIYVLVPSGFFDYSSLPRRTFPQPYFGSTRTLTVSTPSTYVDTAYNRQFSTTRRRDGISEYTPDRERASFFRPDQERVSTTRRRDGITEDRPDRERVSYFRPDQERVSATRRRDGITEAKPDRERASFFRPDQERASFLQSSSDTTDETSKATSAGRFKSPPKKAPTGPRYRHRMYPKKEFSCRAKLDDGNVNLAHMSEGKQLTSTKLSDTVPPAESLFSGIEESASNNPPPLQAEIYPIESQCIDLKTLDQEQETSGDSTKEKDNEERNLQTRDLDKQCKDEGHK